jgi:hypothetical protein
MPDARSGVCQRVAVCRRVRRGVRPITPAAFPRQLANLRRPGEHHDVHHPALSADCPLSQKPRWTVRS